MNREILFRGKRLDSGEWVEGSLVSTKGGRRFVLPSNTEAGIYKRGAALVQKFIEVDPATVGQFTGLEDKNGFKIFEGDICRDEQGGLFLIDFISNSNFRGVAIRYLVDGELMHLEEFSCDRDEIIGNIHDNPELLREEN